MDLLRTVNEFFHEAVHSALLNQGLATTELTEFYLVNLLSECARAEPGDHSQPLALQIAEAAVALPEERAQKLRDVGDRSLYVSGFFSDSLQRSLVDVDYYIRIGGTAYRQLALSPTRSTAAYTEVYSELAGKFPRFVDVLAEVSEGAQLTSNTSVVQLYERWLRTGSEWIARRLRAQGVLPRKEEVQ